ncbi:MAG: hypothetical protein IPK04_02970 [Bdellovibrionales bacterium]|nr:hypothetical protein [Bdellovibrionales bacterium]
MCASIDYGVVAWNPQGSAVVVHRISHGPEGGGSVAYTIVDLAKGTSDSYVVSDNFSPGDGSTPERIYSTKCKDAMTKGNLSLTLLGFKSKFNDTTHACGTSRSNLLSINDVKREALPNEKANKIFKYLGIPNRTGTASIIISNDPDRAILISENGSCSAKCSRLTADKDNKFRVSGDCEREHVD